MLSARYHTMPLKRFAVLMPTYDREALAIRALESVHSQTYSDWILVCVNDSPDAPYAHFSECVTSDSRITYLKNPENLGKNASLNRALAHLRDIGFEGHVVFLDDDDWLHQRCLEWLSEELEARPDTGWIVLNRALPDGTSLTKNKTRNTRISYYADYLILKRFSGDATHCIESSVALACSFPQSAKNGEEWFFFSQAAERLPCFTYLPLPGTYSGGYLEDGVTRAQVPFTRKLALYKRLLQELSSKKLWSGALVLYMFLRLARLFIPKRASGLVSPRN